MTSSTDQLALEKLDGERSENQVAKILSDRDVKKLIGEILVGANSDLLNPNGIELRLGEHVHFLSTGEEKKVKEGTFLRVNPGETVTISSVEEIDFRKSTVKRVLPGCMLMGFVTPTTTMMREGISQVTTKIDAGFHGNLNWGLRNGSNRELVLEHGEPIFKLTIFSLDEDESPEIPYGEREDDSYQDASGIVRSRRRIPADIPKSKIIASSFDKLDPKRQLKEAGYPFDHIGTELIGLDGKFEMVSREVAALTEKIETETNTLSAKIEDTRVNVLEKVEMLFDRKFLRLAGLILGAIPVMYGGVTFLRGTDLGDKAVALIAITSGVVIGVGSVLLSRAQVGRAER